MAGKRRRANAGRVGRILVPLDFTRGSDRALERAGHIAAATRCEVDLLHVLSADAADAAEARAERALLRAQRHMLEVAGPECRVHCQVRTGAAFVEIIRRAREIGADVVLLGRNRAAGRLGATLGRIVHMSDTPLLVVSRKATQPYGRPLVAVELDPYARSLIELTCRLVGGLEADPPGVRVVHAYQVPFASAQRAAGDDSAAFYARASRHEAERSLAQLLGALRPQPCHLEPVVRSGDPRSVIAQEATRIRADLVTVGTHGRSGVAHALLGSIAEWTLIHTQRDILVARPVRFTFVPP